MKKNDSVHRRAEVLEGAPLHYAPQNELGVVFLFSHIAKKLRLRIEEIRPQFPDCIAYQKVGGKEKKIRIEFEFESRKFNHDPKGCDWIVCWEHNWPGIPTNLKVIELRQYYGLGFNVWIQPIKKEWAEILSEKKYGDSWSVANRAHKGDLVLYYRTTPDQFIKDIFAIVSPVEKRKAGYKNGEGRFAAIKRVCTLESPIFFEDLKRHKIIKTAGFVRGSMQGSPKATEYWPYLFNLIIQRNPSVKRSLLEYAPDKL
jgi:hypothetical protein